MSTSPVSHRYDVMARLGYDRLCARAAWARWSRDPRQHYRAMSSIVPTCVLRARRRPADAIEGVTEDEIAAVIRTCTVTTAPRTWTFHRTRPHFVGFGLDDSPIGLAGWILEKFEGVHDDLQRGRAGQHDQLMDDLMTYWLARAATSAARLYCGCGRDQRRCARAVARSVNVPNRSLATSTHASPSETPGFGERYDLVPLAASAHDEHSPLDRVPSSPPISTLVESQAPAAGRTAARGRNGPSRRRWRSCRRLPTPCCWSIQVVSTQVPPVRGARERRAFGDARGGAAERGSRRRPARTRGRAGCGRGGRGATNRSTR